MFECSAHSLKGARRARNMMQLMRVSPNQSLGKWIETPLLIAFCGLAAPFALFTMIYDLALVLSLSLATTMIVWASLLIIAVITWRPVWVDAVRAAISAVRPRARDPVLSYMAALACITSLVALLANKFNEDDSFYMSRAVLSWDNFWHAIPIDYPFAFVNGAGGIFTSLPSYEHFVAGIAALTGLHPLDIYYLVAPAIIGFLLPFAWYVCLRRVGLGTRGAFVGTAFIVILMLLDGTTVRGTANFSLFRIWQGKVILISVLSPLAITTALDAVEHASPRSWLNLLVLGIVGLGLSTSAAFFLPILVGVAGFSWWLIMRPTTPIWPVPLAAMVVFAYPALCILPLYRTVSGPGMIFASPRGSNLADTLRLVYGSTLSPTVVAAIMGVVGLLVARRFRLLLWIVLWTSAIALPVAWPTTAQLIARYGTSTDALWRLAYASPVILTVGLGLGACSEVPRLWFASGAALATCAALTGAFALLHVAPSPFAAAGVIFPTLAYKVPPASLIAAESIVKKLPAGTMLAPESLSVVLPLLTGKLRLTNFRSFDAPLQLILEGHPAEAYALIKAFQYVSGIGNPSDQLAAFNQVIGWGLDYVILGPRMPDQQDGAATLDRAGYREQMIGLADYRVFQHSASQSSRSSPMVPEGAP